VKHGLVAYHVDEIWEEHRLRVTREAYPCLYKWTHTPWDDLWMQPGETLLEEAIACYREQFDIVLTDLRGRSSDERLLVEGSSVLPNAVAEIMADRSHGIWLVPTEGFQRIRYRARGEWVAEILKACREPEVAYRNWMDRDDTGHRRDSRGPLRSEW
jgi:hypothetical protein